VTETLKWIVLSSILALASACCATDHVKCPISDNDARVWLAPASDQVVAILKCNEPVTVVSRTSVGFVKITTQAGIEGYIFETFLVPDGAAAKTKKSDEFDTDFVVDMFLYDRNDDQCSMNLQDGNTVYNLEWRWRGEQLRGRCPEHTSGEHLQGRIKGGLKGYRVEFASGVWPKKTKVETWYIREKMQ
jgi:hypothetical protein